MLDEILRPKLYIQKVEPRCKLVGDGLGCVGIEYFTILGTGKHYTHRFSNIVIFDCVISYWCGGGGGGCGCVVFCFDGCGGGYGTIDINRG